MVPGKPSRLTSCKAVPSVREMVSNHPQHCNPVFGAAEVARTLQLQEYLAQQENAQSAMAKGVSVRSRAILAVVRVVVRSKRISR